MGHRRSDIRTFHEISRSCSRQSIALGTCAGLGTILGPVVLNMLYPGQGMLATLTASVIIGVIVTLLGIAIIGLAGSMKASSLSEEEKKASVKDFNFPKGIAVALLCGLMSACFAIGLCRRRGNTL